jgi:type IV fimbrial biogenesis protein FimT
MHTQARGFTLIELLFTLLIFLILVTLGIPSFSDQIQSSRTRTGALDLLQSLNHARTLAVSHGRRATLSHTGHWEGGWELYIDKNDNGVLDEDEHLISTSQPLKSVRVTANQPVRKYVSFIGSGESRFTGKANGGAFQAGTFTVCPDTPGAGYRLVLARGGRVRMETITAAECNAA